MVGSTKNSSGQIGLVPAPEAGEANRYLRSDGTWAELEAHTAQIFSTENSEHKAHSELISNTIVDSTVFNGDIFIVRDLIHDGKYQHTSYVYDGSEWIAMDGNYNAENVYFGEDFTFTVPVGTVTIPGSGSTVVAAAGKNVKEFFTGLFAAAKDPNVSQPSISITLSGAGSKEVGTKVTPSYSVSFNKGSYQYGPDTGITATYAVSSSANESATAASGSFAEITIGDTTNYSVSVVATHTEGAVPKNNLGDPAPNKKIAAGAKSAKSGAFTGHRKSFYGTLTEKGDVDSAVVRSLAGKSGGALANGSTFNISVPVGAIRVMFAYPATLRDVTSVLDVNGLNAEIKSAFKAQTVQVEGVNGYEAINYKVYVLDFANANDASNTYKVTI